MRGDVHLHEMPRRSEAEDRRREESRQHNKARTCFLAALLITSGHAGLQQEYICPMIAWVQSPHLSAMDWMEHVGGAGGRRTTGADIPCTNLTPAVSLISVHFSIVEKVFVPQAAQGIINAPWAALCTHRESAQSSS